MLDALITPGTTFDFNRCDDYTLSGEIKKTGDLFLHLTDVSKWTPSLYKKLLGELVNIKVAAGTRGLDKIYVFVPNQPKLVKFETQFGFLAESIYKDVYGDQWILMSQGVY